SRADDSSQTMRPVIRGRHAAVSSMKAEATEAARRILDAGGNAFDAAVGGQAALAVSDFSLNGIGSDAVLLTYNAKDKKVYSINAEGKWRRGHCRVEEDSQVPDDAENLPAQRAPAKGGADS